MSYQLAESLKQAGFYLFRVESCTPKYDAQRNLQDKTHYVDDDTLRFHKSRILSAELKEGGAFYYIRESFAATMDNNERKQRVVLFDIFGNTVYHPSIDDSSKTEKQATEAFWQWFNAFDSVEYYTKLFATMAERKEKEKQQFNDAIDILKG